MSITPLTSEWFAAREGRVTGTDVPAILGVSSFKTPLQVFLRLTGQLSGDVEETAFMRWGNMTEQLNRETLLHYHSQYVVEASPGLVIDPEFDWLCATPDGVIWDSDEPARQGVWEGKSPSVYTAGRWLEDAPVEYQVQVQAQMRVTGTTWGLITALRPPMRADDEPLIVHRQEVEREFQERMMETLIRFWDYHVQRDIAPEATAQDLDAVKRLYPKDQGTVVSVNSEVEHLWHLRQDAAQDEKEAKERKAACDAQLRQAIGAHTYAALPSGAYVSLKTQTRTSPPREASSSTFRVLRALKKLPQGIEAAPINPQIES